MSGTSSRHGAVVLIALCLTPLPGKATAEEHRISMRGVAFDPPQIKVHAGDVVEWRNDDIVAHSATARDKSWDVTVAPGKSGRMTIKESGTVSYYCRFHPNMTGQVVIEP